MTLEQPQEGMRVLHYLPGRLRLHVHALLRRDGLAAFLSRELPSLPGVVMVGADARSGNILICFDPGAMGSAPLLQAIGRMVDAWRATDVPGANRGGSKAGSGPGRQRREEKRSGGTLVPDLLAGVTAGLAWYWGQGVLGFGLLSLAGLSRFLRRTAVPPAVERKINLMAGLAAVGSAAMYLAGGQRQRVLAGLIAGNPIATGAAITATCATAKAQLAREGIFVQGTHALFAAGEVDTLVFTATSQLAPLQGQIRDVLPVDPDYTREDIFRLVEEVHQAGSQSGRPGGKTNPWNLNMRARVRGQDIRVGTAAFMKGARVPLRPVSHQARRVTLTGGVPLFVAADGVVVAVIGVEQKISPQGWRDLQGLRSLGIGNLELLTGEDDDWLNPLTVGSAFDVVAGGLTVAEKGQRIAALKAQGHRVAVVGTHPEDGPALAQADLPIVMGSFAQAGWELAPGAGPGPVTMGRLGAGRSLQELFLQGKHLREAYLQNFLTTVGGNVAGLGLAAFGWLGSGWAFAFEAYALTSSAYRWYKWQGRQTWPVHPLTRAEITATSPPKSVLSRRFDPPAPRNVNLKPPGRGPRRMPRQPVVPGAVRATGSLLIRDGRSPAPMVSPDWHSMTPEEVLTALSTSDQTGLTATAVRERLAGYGYNELPAPRARPWWELLGAQLGDFMVQLLLGVAGISALSGRGADALTVVAIVLANASVGVWQEMRAAQSLTSLQQLAPNRARVLRSGQQLELAARELVPGDLVLLAAGDLVPADLRLLEAFNLEVEEASLTGETLPVLKNVATLPVPTPLVERTGMIYGGSCVVRGRGLGVVVATGLVTEMGGIAHSLQDHSRSMTTLQLSMGELGKQMAYGCLAVSALIFGLGLVHRQGIFNMFVTALSLAVAAIPEGLMPMVTIGLAMAVYRMSRRAMVVRRMTAVETLGCVTTICVDKTGTLTKNEMTVREIYAGGCLWLVTGEGYAPQGEFHLQEERTAGQPALPGDREPGDSPARNDLNHLLMAGALCNNARLQCGRGRQEKGTPRRAGKGQTSRNEWYIQGDPTEGALLVAAVKAGLGDGGAPATAGPDGLTRVAEEPFEAQDRQMAVVYENSAGERMLFVKGAPDRILQRCTRYRREGEIWPLEAGTRSNIIGVNDVMSGGALRVLALAYKPLTGDEDWRAADDLVFAGLAGMQDPPRPGVQDSLRKCRQAGVAVMMITGDHPNTARAIAREIGLLDGGRMLTGDELDVLNDSALDAVVKEIRVCARALPRHKLRLVKSLQRRNHVVAMAGDGVNDAPAVQQADIGLAMGLTGTDLTKGVSDMIISDDNFNTIVHGIEEGRAVYDNIRHAVGYLLYTNAGDVVLMLAASVLGLPMPLVPIQLLWINLSGDGLPALAIMADPPLAAQMARPPRPKNESILAGGMGRRIVTNGIFIGLAGFATYWWGLRRYGLGVARTMALGSLGVSQFFHLFDPSLKGDGTGHLPANKYKMGAGLSGLALILAAIYIPAFRGIFQTTPLSLGNWVPVLLGAGAAPLVNRAVGQLTAGEKRDS